MNPETVYNSHKNKKEKQLFVKTAKKGIEIMS